MASKFNYLFDFYEEEISNGIVPELYIDQEILSKENKTFKENHKIYTINEDLFHEDDRNCNDFQEFHLELNNKNEDHEDLIVEIKENSFVVMVNSILLLSCYHWNTITNECPTKCLVCDIIIQDPNGHIKTENHMINLEKHKPLKKFNLHITRLIGGQYHCAVCNVVYERHDNTHLDSETHLERMLIATNRASDVIYDFEINNDNNSENNDRNDNENKTDTVSGLESDGFYNLSDFTNSKSTLRSYASVVKQSTQPPTSCIEHVIGNKTFTIDADTYHMILKPNSREFYCMLCIQFDDVKNTSHHCKSEEHLKKLKQCEIMNIHEEHFIRKVTTKFYHCGTCNNLQLTGAVEAHLESHGKKNENTDKGTEQDNKTTENVDLGNGQGNKTNENKVSKNNENRAQSAQLNVHPIERSINNIYPNINSDIIINRFNCNIRVSFMSYNLILNRLVDFLCLACNFCTADMTLHLKDARHVLHFEKIPFEPFFGINLVRMVHQYAHCAICNILVDIKLIHLHITYWTHVSLLSKALNPNNNNLAIHPNNINSNQLVNTKQPTETNMRSTTENLQAIPTNNSESLNQASVIESPINNNVDLNQTKMDSDLEYDIEDNLIFLNECVYLTIKKSHIKVSLASYHTLVHTGDGNRYCFICSHTVTKSLRGHIESEDHMDRMKKCKFIMNHEKDLLRQVKTTYHCCVCNALVPKSIIENHLQWPAHQNYINIVKKLRKRTKINNRINIEFQTEETCFNVEEQQIELVFKIVFGEIGQDNIGGLVINIPKNKDNGGKIINISWEAWQGITRFEHGVYCNICHDYFVDIDAHIEEDEHKKFISKPIEQQYLPACIRKISDLSLNCITCNLVFPNKKRNISQHIAGKKHVGNYQQILQTAFTDVSLK